MKKIVLFLAVCSLGLFSCKKDYVCECTLSGSSGGVTITGYSETTTIKDTKKKAKEKCEAKSEEDGGFTSTCKIK